MPPVRNGHYINVDDHATNPLHLGSNQVIESKMPMHLHAQHSPNSVASASTVAAASVAKQRNEYGQPSVQHHPAGSHHHHHHHHHHQGIQQTPLSKAELRKSNKPIMEKKRRARINHCLNELKTLILEAMKKDPARHTKLEKADILEMTVKYLQTMQRNQINAANTAQNDPTVLYKFKAGFSDCTNEVGRYINQIDGVDATVKQRLMGHLNNCVTGIQQVVTPPPPPPPYTSMSSSTNTNFPFRPSGFSSSPDLFGSASSSNASNPLYQQLPLNLPVTPEINNNSRIQMGGVQFIPSRLPSGEFALVMPNSGNASEQWKQYYPMDSLSLRPNNLDLNESIPRSAFSNVKKMAKHLDTSPLSPASSMSSIDDSSTTQTDLQTSVDTSSPHRTPPKCLSAFPTPPSGGSITLIPTTTTTPSTAIATHSSPMLNSTITSAPSLQQPHVTSTTEQLSAGISYRIKPISLDMCMKDGDMETITNYQHVGGKKRPHSSQSAENENDDDGEPLPKIRAKSEQSPPPLPTSSPPLQPSPPPPPSTQDNSIKSEQSNEGNNDQSEESGNGDMWRPW